jgi:hypothetical protein
MAANYFIKASSDGDVVQFTPQPYWNRNVKNSRLRLKLINEPEAFLREGKRRQPLRQYGRLRRAERSPLFSRDF